MTIALRVSLFWHFHLTIYTVSGLVLPARSEQIHLTYNFTLLVEMSLAMELNFLSTSFMSVAERVHYSQRH